MKIKVTIRITLCLILFSVFAYCSKHSLSGDNTLPVIDIEGNIDHFEFFNLSEITDNIEYIPLETDSNSLIEGGISAKLILTADRLIINDYSSCRAFTLEGEFICNYGSKGKGPGQFQGGISGVSIDEKNALFYLWVDPKQLLEFSLDGHFIRSIDIPFRTNHASIVALGDFVYFGIDESPDTEERIILFNDSSEIISTYPNYFNDPSLKGSALTYQALNDPAYSIGNQIVYKDGLCDTAYYLDKVNLERKPAYFFNYGKYRQAIDYLKSLSTPTFEEEEHDHIGVRGIIEIGDFLYFTSLFGNHMPKNETIPQDMSHIGEGVSTIGSLNPVRSIFNKRTSELIFLKRPVGYFRMKAYFQGYINDIDGGIPFWPRAVPFGNQLIQVIEAFEFKDYIASDEFQEAQPKYPEKKQALQEMADGLDYNDNPVLMIVYCKDQAE